MVKEYLRSASADGFQMRAISSESDWDNKLAIHLKNPLPPDGKACDPAQWVNFERAKTTAGYMLPFLIVRNGGPIATFSVAPTELTLRVKNVVVDPNYRRIGAATSALAFSCALAADHNLGSISLLALTGEIAGQGNVLGERWRENMSSTLRRLSRF